MAIIRTRPGLVRRRLSTLFLIVCVLALVLFIGTVIRDWFTAQPIPLDGMGVAGEAGKPHRKFRHHLFEDDTEEEIEVQVCKVPSLTLTGDANKHAYYELPPLKCSGEDLFYVRNAVLTINDTVLRGRKINRCEYQAILWQSDSYASVSETLTRDSEPFELKIKHDFFKVECYLEKAKGNNERHLLGIADSDNMGQTKLREPPGVVGGILPDLPLMPNAQNADAVENPQRMENSRIENVPNKENSMNQADKPQSVNQEPAEDAENHLDDSPGDYYDYNGGRFGEMPDFEQYIAQVYPTKEILERLKETKPKKDSLQMNILIFALDSMSHLSYQRKLPKTYEYLKDNLEAFILNAYNIVGDATTAAMIPLLTGKKEEELPEVRRGHEDSHFVDTYPFIWNKLEQSGYVTLYAEDQPSLGTFQLRLNGFEQIPVDHYLRPYWQVALDSMLAKSSASYCLGGIPKHRITLDYIKDFFLRYPEYPKFAMGFLGDLSHADNNPAQFIDEDLLEFVRFLSKGKFLDNTLLIVMGDHGARYSKVRQTVQGKLEERLPMMSLTFPQWFHDRYPRYVSNLRKNVDRLATPFDIHETLRDLIDMSRLERPAGRRGHSLLREIPKNRTCQAAGVDVHWCSCLQYHEVDPSDHLVQEGAAFLLNQLNLKTQNFRDLCRELKLKEVADARKVIPNEALLKFRYSNDNDHRIANFSKKAQVDIEFYQVIILTSPNDGVYESTLRYDLRTQEWALTSEVSRINMYHDQTHCVTKKQPSLMKFCYCNEQLPPHRQQSKGNNKGGKKAGKKGKKGKEL